MVFDCAIWKVRKEKAICMKIYIVKYIFVQT